MEHSAMKIIYYCHADVRLNGGLILCGQFVEKLTESLVFFEQIDLQIEFWVFLHLKGFLWKFLFLFCIYKVFMTLLV